MSSQEIKLAFASCSPDLIDQFVEEIDKMGGIRLPIYCVSEFQPQRAPGIDCTWIPWHPTQPNSENQARIAWHLRGKRIKYNAILLQPRQPYWPMRWVGLLSAPFRTYCFNENYGHFPLHPRGVVSIAKHLAWRSKNWVRHQFRPGGEIYTFVWRLGHPFAWERPFYAKLAARRGPLQTAPLRSEPGPPLEPGITVVIPSRDGKSLLVRLLPQVLSQLEATRILIVDNGSSDETAKLAGGRVEVIVEDQPLSFAAAVNKGIRRAKTQHVCLLNNDMEIEEGFFRELRAAFDRIPDLFCATAQIFFPTGQRRQETGKAVYWPQADRDLPLRCIEPIPGENDSPVLYGSGGCSLYDTAKLKQIGCFKEAYRPAYVEDLDIGWRGWQQGWPTVFVAGAKVVHHHRSTTSRFLAASAIELAIEQNYLRWIISSVASEEAFSRLWPKAVWRLNLRAAVPEPAPIETFALRFAAFHKPYYHWDRPAAPAFRETDILALGSGQITCFPGAKRRSPKPILVIATCYLPFPLSHGGAVRIFNLMQQAQRDYDIILMSFVDEQAAIAPALLALCHEVICVLREGTHARRTMDLPKAVEDFNSEAFSAALRFAVKRYQPFAVQLEFTQMAQFAKDAYPAKTILVEHDITLDLYQQMLRDREDFETSRELMRWKAFEREAWRKLDAVIVMSQKDSASVEGAKKVVVIENGVDVDRFAPSTKTPERRRAIFIGSFAHLPNLMALDWFLREVWPHLADWKLHIISGKNPEYWLDFYRERIHLNLKQPGLEFESFVADVRPAYEQASAVVAPLLASAGTNIKVLEAMAMGKAIVSTPGGVNGLDLQANLEFLLAENGLEFAQALTRIDEDTALRHSLESNAREGAVARFSWASIGAKQQVLYESLRAKME